MPKNKKIVNSHPLEYGGILFKSKLEKMAFITLKEHGLPVKYEPEKFKPKVPFFSKSKGSKSLKQNTMKLIDISYTPDFLFTYRGYLVVIETKGFCNDMFPVKRKLFREWLEKNCPKSIYFEIYSKIQLLQAINIIKNLK